MSDTQIKCTSPDFSKFGAAEVVVRLSISGDPFTVNEAKFIYYANTSAKKSMATGTMPGIRAGSSSWKATWCTYCGTASGPNRRCRARWCAPPPS